MSCITCAAHSAALQQKLPNRTRFLLHGSRRPIKTALQAHHRVDHKESTKDHLPSDDGLPVSLYQAFKGLPPDGKSISPADEMCNPEEQKCKTPSYVYESKCRACFGTGSVRGLSNGKRGMMSTCPLCIGVGFVRRTTTRFAPHITEDGPEMSINRAASSGPIRLSS